jgi:uncharacterized membrane protein
VTTGPPPSAAEDVVTCEIVVPAPPEEVFRWFVRPELLVRWIGIDARLEPRPGGLFSFEIAGCRPGPRQVAALPGALRKETPMAVDIIASGTIVRPRDEVAAYLRDPANDTSWIGGLRSARLLTSGPVAVGSQVERVASFLGRRIEYVNEITELTGDRLAMRSVRSPFPMRVTYGHRQASDGATEVSVRVEGDAGRYYALLAPLLGVAVRRSITRDLRNLKRILEGQPQPAGH